MSLNSILCISNIFNYCYNSVNWISYGLPQFDPVKWLPLYFNSQFLILVITLWKIIHTKLFYTYLHIPSKNFTCSNVLHSVFLSLETYILTPTISNRINTNKTMTTDSQIWATENLKVEALTEPFNQSLSKIN